MLNLFVSPRKAIAEAKHTHSFAYTFLLLVLTGVAAFLGTAAFLESLAAEVILLALLVMAAAVVGTVIIALLVKLSMGVLTGTKGYYEALTLLTLPQFVGAIGFLIAALLGLIPYAGPVLMGVVLVVAATLAYAFSLKLGMELYATDLLTVIIGTSIVYLSVALGVYAGVAKVMAPALIEATLQGVV